MVEELDFALIFISHVNDEGKTRGSRYIGKSAAVLIDLHRNITAATEAERNKTYLTVSKNRFGSITGPAGVLIFNPETFKVEETKESVTESRAERLPS
jgi:predicted ATP-dependent serine protease